jgi:hypothetical protein
MVSPRQKLINKIFQSGIGITSSEFDKQIKLFNNFQMSINERLINLLNDEIEYIKFTDFIRKNCNL